MNIQERYESAKEIYAGLGVDVDAAVERLNHIPVSMHCWQGMTLWALRARTVCQAAYRQRETIRERPGIPRSLWRILTRRLT